MTKLTVFNPIAAPPPAVDAEGLLLDGLTARTMGFLSNNKPNADVVLGRIAAVLQERFGIAARYYSKEVPSLEAPPELIEEIARDCEAVVLAAYD